MYRSTLLRGAAALGVTALAAVLVAAPVGARAKAATVRVTEKDFKITLTAGSVAHGPVVFNIKNVGKAPHDFRIAGKATPVLASGKSAVLKVSFAKAGRYPFSCSVAGHAAMGMKGVLIVR